MIHYSDTSFLFSIYVNDIHSAVAVRTMNRLSERVLITPVGEVELCNAIQLQVFRKFITAHAAQAATQAFEHDIVSGVLAPQPLSAITFVIAKRLAAQHTPTLGTRGFDLIHVASAMALQADVFLSFDKNQRKLAQATGLTIYPKTL